MVRLGCIPKQGGPSAYMENAKAARTAPPGRQEQADGSGKNGPETTTVKSNNSAYRDQTVWSRTEGVDDWREQTTRILERLKKQYLDIVFHLAQEKGAGNLAALAVRAGAGVHLYLSREFVGHMGSGREGFGQCWSELVSTARTLPAKQGQTRAVGVFLGEEGTSYRSVQDKTEREAVPVVSHTGAKETPSTGSNPRVRVSVSLNVSNHFSWVVRTRTKSQMQGAVWDMYRSISNLERAATCDDDQQRVGASRTLRPLRKLLDRSDRKMRKLGWERLKAQEQKKTGKEHQDKRASRLKQEKRRIHSARLGSDADLVKEGHGNDFYTQAYRRFSGTIYKWEHQMPAGIMVGLSDAVPSGDSGMAGTTETRFTVVDVTVSGDTL